MIEVLNLGKAPSGKFRRYNKKFKILYKKIFPARGAGGKQNFELSVVIAPPTFMRRLNKKWRKKDKAANVLSFLLERRRSGEIFLNSKEQDPTALFLHALLHLKGYDHKKNKDAIKMEKLEKKYLNN